MVKWGKLRIETLKMEQGDPERVPLMKKAELSLRPGNDCAGSAQNYFACCCSIGIFARDMLASWLAHIWKASASRRWRTRFANSGSPAFIFASSMGSFFCTY